MNAFFGLIPVALLSAIVGASIAYLIAARNVYINSITAERSKWIDTLRKNLAAYSSAIAHTQLRFAGPEENRTASIQEKLEEINELASLIQLQLNPRGPIDKNVLRIVESIVIQKSQNLPLIQKADDLLISHSQWLLKAEWEKVKYEARGMVYRALHRGDESRFVERYERWSMAQPSIESLRDEFLIERLKAKTE